MRRDLVLAAVILSGLAATAQAQTTGASRTAEVRYVPTARAQMALWLEKSDGTFLTTVRLTQAISYRGIGNRPGASQMNSAYRWPYGRREGVLPIWAHRRAAAAGAGQFSRVIFQDRTSEGAASRTSLTLDSSTEPYFCLSFNTGSGRRDGLDAITCATASPPQTDKGRYLTAADVAAGYAEPTEFARVGMMRMLGLTSLYPPRRDVSPCPGGCADRADVARYDADVRAVMPDIDAVTMATPPADVPQSNLVSFPDSWASGDYVLWVEVNTEGDYNGHFNDETMRTPELPEGEWDSWAIGTGYPYRGQPSVVYRVPFTLGASATFAASMPHGYADVDGFGPTSGDLHPMDSQITDDPVTAKGSGADRLGRLAPMDHRVEVEVRDSQLCQQLRAPEAPANVTTVPVPDKKQSHQWGVLHFVVPHSERPIGRYEVRFSASRISVADPITFDRALPAVAAAVESEALTVPKDSPPGTGIDVKFGGMSPSTTYFVGIRAVDVCNVAGPYAVAEMTTTAINFTKLSGCFIATAAYGSAMEPQVAALRRVRDALRPRHPLFAAAVDLYYRTGPAAAALIGNGGGVRPVVRALLGPVVDAARMTAPLVGGSEAAAAVVVGR
ncbi:MAG: CFI-box-CTERM domain-containing protein [Pseudomonadota bacterium]